jgi:hypothetical protein
MKQWIDLAPEEAQKFGSEQVTLKHNMADSGLFTDEALADLIDRYPREYYMLTTMSKTGEKKIWRNGDKAKMPGKDVLESLKTGQVWLALRRFDIVAPEYQKIIDESMDQLEATNPGLKATKRDSSLLISSPNARVFYHADIPMICLWHLRGRKKVWLYDADNKNHLPDTRMEGIILRETEEEILYKEEWDKDAEPVILEPGNAVSWALNTPHRVDNLEGLNVSITTEFFTPEAKRKYGVYFTNGYLRRKFNYQPKSTRTDGLSAYLKCAVALAIKKSGLVRAEQQREMKCSFELNPEKLSEIIDLPVEKQYVIHQA